MSLKLQTLLAMLHMIAVTLFLAWWADAGVLFLLGMAYLSLSGIVVGGFLMAIGEIRDQRS